MSCLLRGLKWTKTGLRENRVIFQFPDVFKHRPKTGWWPRTGGFTLYAKYIGAHRKIKILHKIYSYF